MSSTSLFSAVADLARLESLDRLAVFCDGLETGEIILTSPTALLQTRLRVSETRLRPYREALRAAPNPLTLAIAIRAASATMQVIETHQPKIEVVWTYPGTRGRSLRTTGGVAREIIDQSRRDLLVVGYSVTSNPALNGLATQTLSALARAAERGVAITAVMHRGVSKSALLSAWTPHTPLPSLFTWPESDDVMAALHAKLLVADREDALITSANLTYHGFERNLEMGIRVTGRAAAEIHDQIHQLISTKELVAWRD